MAIPTPVNGQITDSVTQSSVAVLASAPAVATAALYQSMSHSLGLLYESSVQAQQRSAVQGQAATNQGVIQIYSLGAMSSAAATSKLARSDTPDLLLTLLVVLLALKRK